MKKRNNGITLIALIITIIVLLILAGVTIATLTGEHGILTQAEDAKTKTTKAEAEERFKLIANEWQIAKAKGTSLEDFLADKKKSGELDNVIKNSDGTFNMEFNGQQQMIDNYGNLTGGGETPTFDPETLTIGEAINADKYGWKVKDYTVTADYTVATGESNPGVWRLFYQDNKYTYLITDDCVGSYRPSDYYTTMTDENGNLKYQTGADVSVVGQKLSPIISSLFTESNTNANIKFTAWMTDTSEEGMWAKYKNEDAVFAIGSPTAELFAASYNNSTERPATADGELLYTIKLGLGTYGYTENISAWSNWLSTSNNYGIYNRSSSENWWLASPSHLSFSRDWYGSAPGELGMRVNGGSGDFDNDSVCGYSVYYVYSSIAVRPTVCIPTSVFNSKYLDSVVDE